MRYAAYANGSEKKQARLYKHGNRSIIPCLPDVVVNIHGPLQKIVRSYDILRLTSPPYIFLSYLLYSQPYHHCSKQENKSSLFDKFPPNTRLLNIFMAFLINFKWLINKFTGQLNYEKLISTSLSFQSSKILIPQFTY